ncbi:hypothetical protein ACFLWI_02200 [Chloroflexota bacterium]
MSTATIYARVPSELKDKIIEFAHSLGRQQSETLVELLNQGFLFSESQRKLKETKDELSQQESSNRNLQTALEKEKTELTIAHQKLDAMERARVHLQRILNTEVGRCTVPNCGAPINLYSFAYQQCPQGHSRRIEIYDEYKRAPGVADALVAGLAIFGGVALAAELLGDKNPKET